MIVELALMFFAGNFIARHGVDIIQMLDGTADNTRRELQKQRARLDREREQLRTERERDAIIRELREANQSLAEQVRRGAADRRTAGSDTMRQLEWKRDALRQELVVKKADEARVQFLDKNGRPMQADIDRDHMHIAQYHIGQLAIGKKCSKCGRDMILQFPREEQLRQRNQSRGFSPLHLEPGDIYWGCTGFYYEPQCKNTDPYAHHDARLFAPVEIEEFEVTQSDLETIYTAPAVQRGAAKRLKEHQRDPAKDYLCPVHGEALVLREKREFTGALDQFFLGCPYWKANDAASCNHMVKIKSPAQLAAVLRDYEGKGIL